MALARHAYEPPRGGRGTKCAVCNLDVGHDVHRATTPKHTRDEVHPYTPLPGGMGCACGLPVLHDVHVAAMPHTFVRQSSARGCAICGLLRGHAMHTTAAPRYLGATYHEFVPHDEAPSTCALCVKSQIDWVHRTPAERYAPLAKGADDPEFTEAYTLTADQLERATVEAFGGEIVSTRFHLVGSAALALRAREAYWSAIDQLDRATAMPSPSSFKAWVEAVDIVRAADVLKLEQIKVLVEGDRIADAELVRELLDIIAGA